MKIAWYTPFSKKSAIGRFSRDVVSSLRRNGHTVVVVRSETAPSNFAKDDIQEFDGQVEWASALNNRLEEFLEAFDLVVYNLGDNYLNHAWCVPHQNRHPGITILHDFYLHNLLNGWIEGNRASGLDYGSVLLHENGEDASACYQSVCENQGKKEWLQVYSHRYPVIGFSMQKTLGIVTHSAFYRQLCSERLGCPTITIPLAFHGLLPVPVNPERDKSEKQSKYRLITIGHANPNKCYESIICALGSDEELAAVWEYRVVGSVAKDYQERLSQLAKQAKHAVSVVFTGAVHDQQLQEELAICDVIACLRNPVFEGASASVIEAMQSSTPTIVSDAGCYAEIPDEFVYKVAHGNEVEGVARALHVISRDWQVAQGKANAASLWALSHYHSDAYAERFAKFGELVLTNQAIIAMTDRVASVARRWIAPLPSQCANQLAERISELMPKVRYKSQSHDILGEDLESQFIPMDPVPRLLKTEVSQRKGATPLHAWYSRKLRKNAVEFVQATLSGGYRAEGFPKGQGCWTSGRGVIEVEFQRDVKAHWCWVEVLSTGPRGRKIEFLVDGRVVKRTRRSGYHWVCIPLPNRGKVRQLSIIVQAQAFIPAEIDNSNLDTRSLGVAVGRVVFSKRWWRFFPRWSL